jgi:hypothetical protein
MRAILVGRLAEGERLAFESFGHARWSRGSGARPSFARPRASRTIASLRSR